MPRTVSIDGVNIASMSERQLTRWRNQHIGFIFQSFNLIPVLTAFENVELPLLLTSLSKKQRRDHVMTALAVVGVRCVVRSRLRLDAADLGRLCRNLDADVQPADAVSKLDLIWTPVYASTGRYMVGRVPTIAGVTWDWLCCGGHRSPLDWACWGRYAVRLLRCCWLRQGCGLEVGWMV